MIDVILAYVIETGQGKKKGNREFYSFVSFLNAWIVSLCSEG